VETRTWQPVAPAKSSMERLAYQNDCFYNVFARYKAVKKTRCISLAACQGRHRFGEEHQIDYLVFDITIEFK